MSSGRSRRVLRAVVALLALGLLSGGQAYAQDTGPRPQPRGRIEGRVTGPDGRTVQNVRIYILNDGYSPIANLLTDAAGRFSITVPAGYVYIDVDPLGLPYQRQRQRIEIDPAPFLTTPEMFRVDIRLVPDEIRGVKPASANPGVVFAQEVPKEAQTEFLRGEKLIKGNNAEEGIAALKHAIELFPTYYNAMEMLGSEYAKADKLLEAHAVLTKAIEVNPSGAKSHYALGVVYYKANKHPEAVASFERALVLDSENKNVVIYLGLAQARAGKSAEAEENLEKAYTMGARKVPELHLCLASLYMKDNRYKEAITAFERLLSENPDLRDRKKIEGLIASLKEKAKAKPN